MQASVIMIPINISADEVQCLWSYKPNVKNPLYLGMTTRNNFSSTLIAEEA